MRGKDEKFVVLPKCGTTSCFSQKYDHLEEWMQ
jgi:hypothetical protein